MHQARQLYEEKHFFHWDLEFPEVFIDLERATWKENPGFDVVVGNPPYVRQESFIEIQDYISQVYSTYSGRADIYVYFLERGLSLLANRSFLSYIVSNKFTRANYGRNLRGHLAEHSAIKQMVDFGDLPVFEGVSAYPCILVLQRLKDVTLDINQVLVCRLRELHPDGIEDVVRKTAYHIPQYSLAQDTWRLEPPRITNLVTKVHSQGQSIREFCGEPTRGILTGLNEVFVVSEEMMQNIVRTHPADSRLFKPYVRGRDVERWTPLDPQEYVIFTQGIGIDEYPAVKAYLDQFRQKLEARTAVTTIGNMWFELHQIAGYKQQSEPKIVYPSVSHECRFTLNSDGTIVDKTCYFLLSDSKYLLALLNSSLTLFLFRQLGAERRGGYLEFLGQYVARLPVRCIAFTTPPDERARLVEVGITEATEWIESTEKGSVDSVKFSVFSGSKLGHWLEQRLSPIHTPDPALVRQHNGEPLNEDWQLPEGGPVEQSDVVHDLLAHLAGQMIEMNKEKQAEVKGFLAWLEREIGAPIDNLTRKTYLRNYLGDYQKGESHRALEEVLDILRRNRRRLKVDPSERAFQEQLAGEYEGSLGKLLPLKARLAGTDRLIDLIVYRLYGLTEEEVAVVEGTE